MKNFIKNNVILIIVIAMCSTNTNIVIAGVFPNVNHGFNYQGELIDNGSPANGEYQMIIQGYDSLEDGLPWGDPSVHDSVLVTNGLFSIGNVDIGFIDDFDGVDMYLEIKVRLGGGDPIYQALSPRQKISSVPYANALIKGDAVDGQVYTFTGGKWQPAANNHFSGSFVDLTAVPADIADGDDDTTYTAGAGISIVGTTITNTGDTDTSDDVQSLDDLTNASTSNGFNSLAVGTTLSDSTGGYNSAIGIASLNANIGGAQNTAVGSSAMQNNISGSFNTAVGFNSMVANTGSSSNTAVGEQTLIVTGGSNNTVLGFRAGKNATGSLNVFIGNEAGKHELSSNKLYIENSNSSLPLIGGDFSTDEVVINGKLGVGVSSPDEEIHIKGSGTQSLKVESTSSGFLAEVKLQTDAGGAFDYFKMVKFGSTSNGLTASSVSLNELSHLVAGSGPMLLQVLPHEPLYFATGNALRMTLEGDGDLKLEKKLTAPDTNNSDMKAYIYGSITSSGNISTFGADSGGFNVAKINTGVYTVTFVNSPNSNNYTAMTSMRNNDIGFITVYNDTTYFEVRTYDTSGVLANKAFNFVVYKQ